MKNVFYIIALKNPTAEEIANELASESGFGNTEGTAFKTREAAEEEKQRKIHFYDELLKAHGGEFYENELNTYKNAQVKKIETIVSVSDC